MKKLLYIQIAENIMQDVVCGKYMPNDKVLSVRDMAMEIKVNPKTIQKAFEYLENKKIFVVVVGEGRFITNNQKTLQDISDEVVNQEVLDFVNKMKIYNYNKEQIIDLINKSK